VIAQWPPGGTYATNPTGWTTPYSPTACSTNYFIVSEGTRTYHGPELEELLRARERAEKLIAAREDTREFIERRFGAAPGPGRPSPKHATCSRRRFHRRTKP
jgi:hypothetical protein